ncbi:MAG: hypothetical protein WCF76_10000, partial [Pseudolabrys sp.]
LLVARQAADVSGENAIPAENHEKLRGSVKPWPHLSGRSMPSYSNMWMSGIKPGIGEACGRIAAYW